MTTALDWWPDLPTAPSPTTKTRRQAPQRLVLVVAAAIAVLLVADLAGLARVASREPQVTGVSGPLHAELQSIARWVESDRGLRFEEDVEVRVLSPARFADMIRAKASQDDQTPAAEQAAIAQAQADVLYLLGIADRRFDVNAVADAYAAGVAGSYDPEGNVLNLPDQPLTPFRRQVIAHELTHALDDQHFALDRPPRRLVDESQVAFRALAEGDATDVEAHYVAAMTPEDRAAASKEEQGAGDGVAEVAGKVPGGVLATFGFPYAAGGRFAAALRAGAGAAGNAAVDAAFRNPPTTSEQILHPERFTGLQGPLTATRPRPDLEAIDRGVVGELGLRLVAANLRGGAFADQVGTGWGGDRYVAWKTADGRICVREHLVMDTPQDLEEARTAFEAWRAARRGAAVTPAGNELHLEACT